MYNLENYNTILCLQKCNQVENDTDTIDILDNITVDNSEPPYGHSDQKNPKIIVVISSIS